MTELQRIGPHIAELFEAQRHKLIGDAASQLVDDIKDKESKGHRAAYFFALKTFGKEEGFTERQELTGANGSSLIGFSPDMLKLMGALQLDPLEALKHFEGMLRARAAQLGVMV